MPKIIKAPKPFTDCDEGDYYFGTKAGGEEAWWRLKEKGPFYKWDETTREEAVKACAGPLLHPPTTVHVRETDPDGTVRPNAGDLWFNQVDDRTYKWDGRAWDRVHRGGVVTAIPNNPCDEIVLPKNRVPNMPSVYYDNGRSVYGFMHNGSEYSFATHQDAWSAAQRIADDLVVIHKPATPEHYGDF